MAINPSVAEYLRTHPGRVILTIAQIGISISERAAVALVMANPPAARLCECGAYHMEPNYVLPMILSNVILDVSELNGRDDMDSAEAAELLAKTLAMEPTPHRVDVPPEAQHKPAPPFVAGELSPAFSKPRTPAGSSSADIETRAAIRKADWYGLTAAPILFRTREWIAVRANSVQGDGDVEAEARWLVDPKGGIEKLPQGLENPAGSVDLGLVKRLAELDALVPLAAIRARHRIPLAIFRWLSGAYFNLNPETM